MINPLSAVARIFKTGLVAQASSAARPAAVAASLARQLGGRADANQVPGRTDPNAPLPVVGRERFAFLQGLDIQTAQQGLTTQRNNSAGLLPCLTMLQKARMVMAGVDEHGRKVGLDMRQKLSFQRHMNWHGFSSAAIAEREGVQAQASQVLAQTQAALLDALAAERNGVDAMGWANRLLAVLPLHLHSDEAFAAWAGPDLNVHVQAGPTADGQQGETRTVNLASYQDLVALARGRLPGVSSPTRRATMQLSGDVMSRLANEVALEQTVANPRTAQPLVSTAAYTAYLKTEQRVHEVRHLGATALQLLRRLPGAVIRAKAESDLADRVAHGVRQPLGAAIGEQVTRINRRQSGDDLRVSKSKPAELGADDRLEQEGEGPHARIQKWLDGSVGSTAVQPQAAMRPRGIGQTLDLIEEEGEPMHVALENLIRHMKPEFAPADQRQVDNFVRQAHAFMEDFRELTNAAASQPKNTSLRDVLNMNATDQEHYGRWEVYEFRRLLEATNLPSEEFPSLSDFRSHVRAMAQRLVNPRSGVSG